MSPPASDKSNSAGARFHPALAFFACGAALVSMWMLLHPYRGVVHDATLYTLAALARLQPDLANDVFLKFGSQDRYTIFSPIFSAAIGLFDLEPAAAVLTFIGHIGFFGSAWLLARRFMPARFAALAVALLVVMPSGYGAYRIFNYVEDFLTPRLFAEALALGSLAMALAGRPVWSTLLIAIAVLLHPIMASAGIITLALLWFVVPQPRLGLTVGALAAAALIITATLVTHGPFARIDSEWLRLLNDRSLFLFLSYWRFEDWIRAFVPMALLVHGALLGTNPQLRKLCLAALLGAAVSLLANAIACDIFHLANALRAQPWRCLWIAQAIGILIVPALVHDCWSRGALPRIALLLLAAAWMYLGQRFNGLALAMLLMSLSAALVAYKGWQPSQTRLLTSGTIGALLLAVGFSLLDKGTLLIQGGTVEHLPVLARLQVTGTDGILPAAILFLIWWRAFSSRSTTEKAALAAAGLIALLALLPSTVRAWTSLPYNQLKAAFAPWQEQIPARAEVLWPYEPLGIWYWLGRASYISLHQTAGIVFSRETALELYRRAQVAGALLPEDLGDWTPGAAKTVPKDRKLSSVCSGGEIDFVVTDRDEGWPPLAAVAPHSRQPLYQYRLYRCTDIRG